MEMAYFKRENPVTDPSQVALRKNQPLIFGPRLSWHLDPGFPTSRLRGNEFLLLRHLNCGHFLPYQPWSSQAEGKITRPSNDQRGRDGAGGIRAGFPRKGQRVQKSRAFTLGRKQWTGWMASYTHTQESELLVLRESQSWAAQTWLRLAHVCLNTYSPQPGTNSTAGFLYG